MPTSPILNDSCESIPVLPTRYTIGEDGDPLSCSCRYKTHTQDLEDVDHTSMTKKVSCWGKTKCIYPCMILLNVVTLGITATLIYVHFGAGFVKNFVTEDRTTTVSPSIFTPQIHHMLHLNYEDKDGVAIRWKCPKNGTSSFECDGKHVKIPVTGWYILHLKIAVNTNLSPRRLNRTMTIRDCIVKNNLKGFRDMEHCVRMEKAPNWRGPSEVIVMRQYLRQGEIIKAVSLTKKFVIDHDQSMMEIALAERD